MVEHDDLRCNRVHFSPYGVARHTLVRLSAGVVPTNRASCKDGTDGNGAFGSCIDPVEGRRGSSMSCAGDAGPGHKAVALTR